jgi:hypothetical protein
MGLVDLKSNLANFRSDFKTPSVESQAVKKLNQPTAVKDTFLSTDSRLDKDTIPSKFSVTGVSKLSNTRIVNRSSLNIDPIPTVYKRRTKFTKRFVDKSIFNRDDEFILKYTGRTRFTKKYVNAFSKFNIDLTPDKFTTVGFSRLSVPKFVNRSKFNIDSTPNKFSTVGVSNLSKLTFINSSKFNLDENPSKFSSTGIYAPSKLQKASVVNASKFNIDNKPAKFSINGNKPSKYNDGGKTDKLYKSFNERFNLRDTAFNYSYINHPLILRGIQRKGNEKPNRWGVDGLVNFDSGLVRGGITAAMDRVAADQFRISKWMASPKGLLWITKQIGLGLSNPNVEAIGGILTRQTRIHTGLAVLGSIPSHVVGIHLTRHGIPFANKLADYEQVSKTKNLIPVYNTLLGNRLIKLSKSVLAQGSTFPGRVDLSGDILWDVSTANGGPQSVYGIGPTTIRRSVDTRTKSIERAVKDGFRTKWTVNIASNKVKAYAYKLRTQHQFNYLGNDKGGIDFDARSQDDIDSNPGSIKYEFLKILDSPIRTTPYTPYKPQQNNTEQYPNGDEDANKLIKRKKFSDTLYAGFDRAKTGKDTDPDKSESKQNISEFEKLDTSLNTIWNDNSDTTSAEISLPNSNVLKPNPFYKQITIDETNTPLSHYIKQGEPNIKSYATLAYNKIKRIAKERTNSSIPNDFRNQIGDAGGARVPEFVGKQNEKYYEDYNLEKKYGFSKSNHHIDVTARGKNSFIQAGKDFDGTAAKAWNLVNDAKFTGDKINAIDIIKDTVNAKDIYDNGSKDFIKFYFADGDKQGSNLKRVMAFRATITGLSDTFSPSWGSIQIMGRPDSVYRYESFERSISFTFTAHALSRSEMIPMWRKLNYLASFTAPDWVGGFVAGPFMRLTLGDLYQDCPGFLESLSYTIPDDATWDIADDTGGREGSPDAKQLPTAVEVSVGYKIIGTHRPNNMGRMYALSNGDTKAAGAGQWLGDAI